MRDAFPERVERGRVVAHGFLVICFRLVVFAIFAPVACRALM